MKKIFLIFLLLTLNTIIAQNDPNDCINSIVTCGNSDVSIPVSGIGTQELNGTNTCSSQENNSLWLKVTPATSGTLGFVLTPSSSAITEDYDFFVYGPNVTCGALGNAIRCSTTNPQAAAQGNNLTGMNSSSTDNSEGPGPNGNSFVSELNVVAGETYFIIIDRPIGNSSFNLEWTGTAIFSEPPTNDLPTGTNLSYEKCDEGINMASFDLTQDQVQLIGTQNVTINYFETIEDAQINSNPIPNPNNYNTITTTTYIRLTDNLTSCFSIFDINLTVIDAFPNAEPNFIDANADYCNNIFPDKITLTSGIENNNLNNYTFNWSPTGEITPEIEVNTAGNYDLTVTSLDGCTATRTITVTAYDFFEFLEPSFSFNDNLTYCEDIYPETIDLINILENNDISTYTFNWFLNGNALNLNTSSISINLTGEYTVVMTNPQGCIETKTFQVNGSSVFSSTEPNFIDSEVPYCINTSPTPIIIDAGIENNNVNNYDYDWYLDDVLIAGDEDYTTLSGLNTIPVFLTDDNPTLSAVYTVVITNTSNCSIRRNITVIPSEIATIENVIITDANHNDFVSLIVEIDQSTQGDYQYAIDVNNDESYQDENYFDNVPFGTHTIYVRDVNGCETAQKEILLLDYPKFITPNNDDANDTWNINNEHATNNNFNTVSNIIIFDRQGKIMANINPKGIGWDGNYLGEPAPPSDYWFIVELIDYKGKIITKKGHFALKRIK